MAQGRAVHTHRPACRTVAESRARLRAAADALDAFVNRPHPGGFKELGEIRWTFTRDLMLHSAHVQSRILDPLFADARPDVAERATASSDDLRRLHDRFIVHAERWQGLPPRERWNAYREAICLLLRHLRTRLTAEEIDLTPLLPAVPGGERIEPDLDPLPYARLAWTVRRLIYPEEQRSAASGPYG